MPNKPPYTPTGFTVAMLTNDGPKLGVLLIETADGDLDFHLNLVPLHRGFDGLILVHSRIGKFSGATRISMLRATPGWRRTRPARSSVRTIW
jgi:hypothetical protein